MAQTIKPFRGTYYNSSLVKSTSSVVCPPYDVINKDELRALRKKSSYNFTRVLLADKNKYEVNRQILDSWLKKGVLIDDNQESLYLYEQRFKAEGRSFVRFGVITLLGMDRKGIFPHERTHKAPKEDRKRIIKTLEANLSPIFVIGAKRMRNLAQLHKQYSGKKPLFECKDRDNNVNKLWKISDKKQITLISKEVAKAKLIIADGHHRFEVSYDYFKKHKNKFKDLNYLLAYVTDCQDGLTILPTHRVMDINEPDAVFFKKLGKYFEIEKLGRRSLELQMKQANSFCLGIYRKGKFYFLELKDPKILGRIPNKLYRELDPYIFHYLVLPLFKDKVSGASMEYTHDIPGVVKLASRRKTAFILRAARLDAVIKISSKGFRLPQKSTYFYPKLLSGLVIRRFGL